MKLIWPLSRNHKASRMPVLTRWLGPGSSVLHSEGSPEGAMHIWIALPPNTSSSGTMLLLCMRIGKAYLGFWVEKDHKPEFWKFDVQRQGRKRKIHVVWNYSQWSPPSSHINQCIYGTHTILVSVPQDLTTLRQRAGAHLGQGAPCKAFRNFGLWTLQVEVFFCISNC